MSVQDREGRVGPFATYVERVRPDGVVARWDSRRNRKHRRGAPATGEVACGLRLPAQPQVPTRRAVRRPRPSAAAGDQP